MTDTSREISDLRLADFAPRPTLVVTQHEVRRARFPAIDAHNHLEYDFIRMWEVPAKYNDMYDWMGSKLYRYWRSIALRSIWC